MIREILLKLQTFKVGPVPGFIEQDLGAGNTHLLQQIQQSQLYYRRYRRYSCTTADAAVPKFGTGTAVFKCISPIDPSYRNDSKCRK